MFETWVFKKLFKLKMLQSTSILAAFRLAISSSVKPFLQTKAVQKDSRYKYNILWTILIFLGCIGEACVMLVLICFSDNWEILIFLFITTTHVFQLLDWRVSLQHDSPLFETFASCLVCILWTLCALYNTFALLWRLFSPHLNVFVIFNLSS